MHPVSTRLPFHNPLDAAAAGQIDECSFNVARVPFAELNGGDV
jgi:hypothetical protein